MNIITSFAEGYNSTMYSYSTSTESVDPAVAAGILFFLFAFYFLFIAVMYVVSSLALMKIFKKAGVPGWIAWVPFYNSWKMLEIGGQQGFWAVLAIIPFANIVSAVFTYIAMYHIGKKLDKEGVFVLLAIFLPLVWLIWLAVDKSKWNDKASSAPSLDKTARKTTAK